MDGRETTISASNVTADLAVRTLAMIVAGAGDAARGELASVRARSALPFGGQYSSIDFPFSNCVNSGIPRIAVLAEEGTKLWLQHVRRGPYVLRPAPVSVEPAAPYTGTADAVRRNLAVVAESSAAHVLVHVGDDVCRSDYRAILETHVATGLGATMACVEVPIAVAHGFGVVGVGPQGRVVRFADRPTRPQPLPDDPEMALVSTGVYVFDRDLLVDCLSVDAEDRWSTRDLSRDVLPLLIRAGDVAAHVFRDARPGHRVYWRELGTLDRYWRANVELLEEQPALDLGDRGWPLWAQTPHGPPARIVGGGLVERSIVSTGCVVGGRVQGSVLCPECVVRPGAVVSESVLLPGVEVGYGSRVRRAVVDAGCVVPDLLAIGDDPARDAAWFDLSGDGVALVTAAGLERAARALDTVSRAP
jgi:glucose-1-phosphate adenylyltransferase